MPAVFGPYPGTLPYQASACNVGLDSRNELQTEQRERDYDSESAQELKEVVEVLHML